MQKYRGTLENEDEVTWLDNEELVISDVWLLSLEPLGMGGMSCNYQIIKDYSKQNILDYLEVYRVCKSMTSVLNEKD